MRQATAQALRNHTACLSLAISLLTAVVACGPEDAAVLDDMGTSGDTGTSDGGDPPDDLPAPLCPEGRQPGDRWMPDSETVCVCTPRGESCVDVPDPEPAPDPADLQPMPDCDGHGYGETWPVDCNTCWCGPMGIECTIIACDPVGP